VIHIEQLDFSYGAGGFRLAIDELRVDAGEAVAFIGPSGSGKTTLLHLIAGIVAPEAGRIEASGVEVTALSDSRRRDFRVRNVGLVFQEFELLEYLTVLDNILLPYRINRALELNDTVRDRARTLAAEMGLGDKLVRFPSKLSQGERQRVAVCRALLPEPALLMADEPTGNLDPTNKSRVLDLLFDYAERTNTTLLTVTHDHDLLPRFERVVDIAELVQ
jgi:ABC-type lipoprotein export system ATPase subunit